MFSFRVQNGCELPMMFEQHDTVLRHAVDSRARAIDTLADTNVAGVEQPLEAPIETVAGMIEAPDLHKFKKLVMAYKLRVAHLPEQGNIALSINDEAALGVSHRYFVRRRQHPQATATQLQVADSGTSS